MAPAAVPTVTAARPRSPATVDADSETACTPLHASVASLSVPGIPTEAEPPPVVGGVARSLRSAAVYTAVLAVQRAIALIMLPLFTRALDPGEYGTLGVLISVATLAGIVFAAGLEVAIVRFYFTLAGDPARQRRFVDSVWRFLTVWPLAAALVASAAAWPFVGSGEVSRLDVVLTLVGAALGVSASTFPLILLRARQDLRRYIAAAATPTIATPLLTVLFVVVMDLGLSGFVLGIAVANALSLAAAAVIVPWRPEPGGFDRALVRGAVAFSVPLLPHTLSHWGLQFADRAVLAGLVSTASLGRFVLAANLSAPLLMVLIALNQGFMPAYARAATGEVGSAELRRHAVAQIVVVAGLTLAAALLGAPLAELLAPDSYAGAGALVPWIVLGYGFLGLYFVPMNGATLAAGRSRFVWVATATAAAFNVGLLYLLVPSHGVEAAAIASAAAYGVLLTGTFVWAHARPSPVRYEWRRILPALAVAALVYALATATSPQQPELALAVHAAWLGAYPLAIVGVGVIPAGRLAGVWRR